MLNGFIAKIYVPIPKMEAIIACLTAGEKYTKLDKSHAYQQIVLDEELRKCVTVNTHKGLFTYIKVTFWCEFQFFQCIMESKRLQRTLVTSF